MTERMTRDITARITTMAMPMPFQFRGGPSVLPRSWYRREDTHTMMNVCTAEEEDISAASFPQSHRNFSLTVTSVQRAPPPQGRGLRPVFPESQGLCWITTNFPYEKCIKLLHMRDETLIEAEAILAHTVIFLRRHLISHPTWVMGGQVVKKCVVPETTVCLFFWRGSGFIHHPAGLDEVINKAIKKRGLLHVTIQWVTAEAAAAEFHVSAEVFVRHQWWTSQRLHQSQLNTSACALLFPWCTPAPS